jgi:hypothetical protein
MNYSDAFRRLGYALVSPRQDWSAEKADGVVLTLWTLEMIPGAKKRRVDTRLHSGDIDIWKSKPGNTKRRRHISRAVEEFDGWIDVILVDGTPGQSYGNADPWNVAERKSRWRVTYFSSHEGHFAAEPFLLIELPA